jgi:hypothetical protein
METAKEVIQELKNNRYLRNDISYFRKVELLLYNYSSLIEAVKQKDEDIAYIERNGLPQKSGSIVVYQTSGGNISGQDRYMQIIEKYRIEKLETEREIQRIENALDKIKDDGYFKIIHYKYLIDGKERLTDEEIAERLEKDQSTISRNRKRLVNCIKVILFPESIRDFV